MRAAFHRMLTDIVYHAPFLDDDASGAPPTFGPVVRRRCRIERGNFNVLNAQGQEVPTKNRIFLDGSVTIDPRDRLVLDVDAPTIEDVERASPIMALAVQREPHGVIHHVEVWC